MPSRGDDMASDELTEALMGLEKADLVQRLLIESAEVERLRAALVSIAEHLGAGHHEIACDGCDYEIREVRATAQEALGDDLPEYLRKTRSAADESRRDR